MALSNLTHIPNDTANVINEVQSATARVFLASTSGFPRINRMKSTPIIGANVMTESQGKLVIALAHRYQKPGRQARNAQQHGKSIVI